MVTAPLTPGIYEYVQATQTWRTVVPYEAPQGIIGGQLSVNLSVVAPRAPTAPFGLALVSKTDTTISVKWQEDPDSTVGGHRFYTNGVKHGTDGAAAWRGVTFTSLTPDTPYQLNVTRFNSIGQESPFSNTLSVRTNVTAGAVPTAPTGFVVGSITSSGGTASWAESADASVLHHYLYLDGVRYGATLSASALSAAISGLQPDSPHSAYVTRDNGSGESSPSNVYSFRTSKGSTTVVHDVVMGVPDNNQADTLRIQSWPAARVYDFTGAQGTVTKWGCRVIGLTDPSATPSIGSSTVPGYVTAQQSANAVKNFLEGFYYTSTGAKKNTNVETHYAHGNEIAKDPGFTSGTLDPNYIEGYRLTRLAIDTQNPDGTKRYPMASLWVDLTAFQIKSNGAGPRFKAIAPYLDGLACSVYPPGRQTVPTVFTPYASYAGLVMDVMDDWFTTYPNCRQFATWEVGSPIDHAVQTGAVMVLPNGEPTAQTNITIRPRYFTGGIDSAGTNWLGFLQYIYNRCDAMGVAMREQCYWNKQSSVNIPNRLLHDKQPRTVPDTETAWHDWVPGKRLPNG